MAFYRDFVSTRTTLPDFATLLTALRSALGADAGVNVIDAQHYRVKRSALDFTAADVTAAQNAIDTTAASTLELTAQSWIDRMPVEEKAILLTLLDEINRLRGWLASFKVATAASTSLADFKTRVAALPDTPDRTPAQAVQAVRDKAGTL